MPKMHFSGEMAGAVPSAVLTVGSLSLAATPASACGGPPKCNGGPPPVGAVAACQNPAAEIYWAIPPTGTTCCDRGAPRLTCSIPSPGSLGAGGR
jgi:hypothetical protein